MFPKSDRLRHLASGDLSDGWEQDTHAGQDKRATLACSAGFSRRWYIFVVMKQSLGELRNCPVNVAEFLRSNQHATFSDFVFARQSGDADVVFASSFEDLRHYKSDFSAFVACSTSDVLRINCTSVRMEAAYRHHLPFVTSAVLIALMDT